MTLNVICHRCITVLSVTNGNVKVRHRLRMCDALQHKLGGVFDDSMLALSIPILICVILIVIGGIVQAWLLLRCSWQLPPPTGKLKSYFDQTVA